MLIFVFTRISYGLSVAILAEFGAVPNAPSDVVPPRNPAVLAAAAQARPTTPAAPIVLESAAIAEHGGPRGPEPTRFGDWERNGRCIDF